VSGKPSLFKLPPKKPRPASIQLSPFFHFATRSRLHSLSISFQLPEHHLQGPPAGSDLGQELRACCPNRTERGQLVRVIVPIVETSKTGLFLEIPRPHSRGQGCPRSVPAAKFIWATLP